eukprot:365950-Chlamydomonas_euryale.AAC.5
MAGVAGVGRDLQVLQLRGGPQVLRMLHKWHVLQSYIYACTSTRQRHVITGPAFEAPVTASPLIGQQMIGRASHGPSCTPTASGSLPERRRNLVATQHWPNATLARCKTGWTQHSLDTTTARCKTGWTQHWLDARLAGRNTGWMQDWLDATQAQPNTRDPRGRVARPLGAPSFRCACDVLLPSRDLLSKPSRDLLSKPSRDLLSKPSRDLLSKPSAVEALCCQNPLLPKPSAALQLQDSRPTDPGALQVCRPVEALRSRRASSLAPAVGSTAQL